MDCSIERPEGRSAERSRHGAIDHELHVELVVREVHQIGRSQLGRKFGLEELGIRGALAEGDESARVPQDRIPDLLVELREVLVREHEAHAIFTQLREHRGVRERREALELIQVEVEVPPFRFREVGPA